MSRQRSDATTRALARVRRGENPHAAARAEKIHPSTIYRALRDELRWDTERRADEDYMDKAHERMSR